MFLICKMVSKTGTIGNIDGIFATSGYFVHIHQSVNMEHIDFHYDNNMPKVSHVTSSFRNYFDFHLNYRK